MVTFVSLAACGTGGDATIGITFDACAPLALVSTAPTDAQYAGIDAAQALWRVRGAPSLGYRAGTTLEVRFESASAVFHGQYDDTNGVIYINTAVRNDQELPIVIAHELGHAFGLLHISNRPSVMNPGNLSIEPNAEDALAIAGLWGTCN